MELTFEEAVEYLEDGLSVTLECDDYEYEISEAHNWVGGDGMEGYISQVLGNVVYGGAKNILRLSIDHLSDGGKREVIITE